MPGGPQRRRQDHHPPHDHGLPAPARGPDPAPRRRHPRPAHPRDRPPGLGFAPEDSGIFPDLTVAENIEISTWTRPGGRPAAERIERAYEVFPVLRKYRARKGPEMSGGERKMLSIARALALDPAMLLLDEPFEGLSPAIVPTVSRGLAEITQRGHAILHRGVQHPPRARVRHAPLRHRARRDHLRGAAGRGAARSGHDAGDRRDGLRGRRDRSPLTRPAGDRMLSWVRARHGTGHYSA